MKILWLASWYPSRIEPFNGDFIQRHAEATSLYHDIDLIHVIKDPQGAFTKSFQVETERKERLREQIIYYFNPVQRLPVLGKLFSVIRYYRIFKKQIAAHIRENGKPDLVHVHVCMRAGLLALWLKRKYGLPYVVSEHASQFLAEAENNIYRAPGYYRFACKKILQKANRISAVSYHLGEAIRKFAATSCERIPNVVNTAIFKPGKREPYTPCTFIHVSGLEALKNLDTILSAFALLKEIHSGFVLNIVGSDKKEAKQKAMELGLADNAKFHAEMPQTALAEYMKEADALILFSRYETFGCVLIEAAACGTPVIVNDIPVMQENVKANFNGLIVQNNVDSLAKALADLIEKKVLFDKDAIAIHTKEKYGYETIGQQFSAFYNSVLI